MMLAPSPDLPAHPFTRAQALELGLTDRQLRRAVEKGELRRIFHGVYLPTDLELDDAVRAAALALVVPPHVVVCDRTAAWLHGVNAFGYGDQDLLMPLEVCSLRGSTRTRHRQVDGAVRDLLPGDLVRIGAVTATTPLRTALDLGCALTRLRAMGVLDAICREHGIRRDQALAELSRYRRRRGVVQLRQLVPLVDPRAESQRESATRLLILDAGLPAPELQWWVEVGGVSTWRLDLAYPHLRIAIEYDGKDFHDRTEGQRIRDRDRRDWLRRHGWTVIVVDADNLFAGENSGWLRELRDALRSRTKRFRWSRAA